MKPISQSQLDNLEKALDRLWASLGVDIEFTRHFIDRVNDERNKKQITIPELQLLFHKVYKKYGPALSKMNRDDIQAVLTDIKSNINIPFVLKIDRRGELDLVSKTVMRKKDFRTSNKKYVVEGKSYKEFLGQFL